MTIKFFTIQFYIHTQLIWTWLGYDITKKQLEKDSFGVDLVWIHSFHFIFFFFYLKNNLLIILFLQNTRFIIYLMSNLLKFLAH